MQAVKPDIASESRFLPTQHVFDAPVSGVPVGVLLRRLVRKKLEWSGYPMVEKNDDMFICFDRIYESDGHTDTQTDRQTPHDDINRASIASRGKNGYVYASHDQ